MATNLVRVRKGDFEINVSLHQAIVQDLEVLDDEPTHIGRRPRACTRAGGRPVKPKQSIDDLAAEKALLQMAFDPLGTQDPVIEPDDDGGGEPADSTDNPAFEEEI